MERTVDSEAALIKMLKQADAEDREDAEAMKQLPVNLPHRDVDDEEWISALYGYEIEQNRCPKCGSTLDERTRLDNGDTVLMCDQWPSCNFWI